MSERLPKLLLEDILDSANKIIIYTEGLSYEDFCEDSKTIDAVIRNFEIIGEATNRLPDDLKDNNPEVDWHKIRGLRNRIAHGYFGISFKVIWDIKEESLPLYKAQVESLLQQF